MAKYLIDAKKNIDSIIFIEENIDNIDCMLTELKAAAVDVATKDALNKGLEVVYCDNIPIAINDEYDLDKSIMNIVYEAKESFNKKRLV